MIICAVFIALLLREQYSPRERSLQRAALLFFLIYIGIVAPIIIYRWYPTAFVLLAPLFYACHTSLGAVLYYMVWQVTSSQKQERFPVLFKVFPLVVPVVLAVWLFFIPFEVPLSIVTGIRKLHPQWPVFSWVFESMLHALILFVAFFSILSYIKLHRYHRSLTKAKRSDSRYKLRWVTAMILLTLSTWLHTLPSFFTSLEESYSVFWPFALMISPLYCAQAIMILYNLQHHNYPPLAVAPKQKQAEIQKQMQGKSAEEEIRQEIPASPVKSKPAPIKIKSISKKDFDRYFRKEKPYLNPELTLISLSREMEVNRTELSNFINRTYGEHFNIFVNRWRLAELGRIKKLVRNKGKTIQELLPQAGFATISTYARAKKAIDSSGDKNMKITPNRQNNATDSH